MYAIFETGGKQYKAAKGEIVFVEKLNSEPGKLVSFDALVVADGDKIQIGTPIVKGVKVKAKIVEHGKANKVVSLKYKPKNNSRKKQGHRQPYTKIQITGIATAKEKEEAVAAE
jgi:large subunit ribosomal protein L21